MINGRSSRVGPLQDRISLLWMAIYLCGAGLGARLVHLQVVQRAEYALAAERNRTQIIYQAAPRGRFYDRDGVVLATNEPAFSLIYLPPKGSTAQGLASLAEEIAKHLDADRKGLQEKLQQAMREETAVRLAENLPTRAMFRLSELKTLYPGIDLVVEARRRYPFGRFASHLLGYMGRMDQHSWGQFKARGYRIDSRIGKMGLERVFEFELRGKDGGIVMEVDAQGRLKGILERIPWQPGSNIHLTLDAAVQKAADEGLRSSLTGRGAAAALDPRTGAILAMSSAPDFDPNDFLSSDPDLVKRTAAELPEFNRAIAGAYAPGSAFKVVVGAAGLNEGRFTTSDAVYCPGHTEIGGRVFLCWEAKGHRTMTWFPGLTNSCDVYFYRMGLRTGGALIERYAGMFGLGAKTNVALKWEKKGNLFGPRAKGARAWYDGDTANLAIGQGELLVTPMQMAVLAAAMASRGVVWRPHFTSRIEYTGGRPEYKQMPEQVGTVALKESTWRDLHEAMRLVVSSGTGRTAIIPGLEVYGKTGTSQNPGKDHAWFVSFAARPGEVPSVAVAVLVENGEHGGSAAGPIARSMMMAAFGMADPQAKASPLPAGMEVPHNLRAEPPARLATRRP
ncbi:MAG: penicillin-binding protein 2 [Elusimicrobia bacterium]|nr:penicillin-binding protein 2 [Elusimicrobiota bacterium]